MTITVEEIATHLRIDNASDHPELDDIGAAAEDWVAQYLGRDLPWSTDTESQVYPAAVKAAVLLVCGDLYENREGAIVGTIHVVNPTVERLLTFYRDGMGC